MISIISITIIAMNAIMLHHREFGMVNFAAVVFASILLGIRISRWLAEIAP